MSNFGFVDVLSVAQTDGAAVASTTSRTSLTPVASRFTTPTTGFWYVGKRLRLTATGRVSTTSGSNTLTLAFGVGSVDAWSSQAVSMVASQTNQTWRLQLEMTTRAVGAGGSATANLLGVGMLNASAAVTASTTMLPASAPAVGTSFDPGIAAVLDLFATWSASSASNSVTCHSFTLEALN